MTSYCYCKLLSFFEIVVNGKIKMDKIKIGFFCGFFPVISGGAEYQTYLLSKCLDPERFDIFFLSLDSSREGPQTIQGIKVYFFKSHNAFLNLLDTGYISNYKYIKSVIQEEKPDVMYQMMANSATWILQHLSNTFGFKFIWSCASDADFWSIKLFSLHGLLKTPEFFLKRRGIRNADLILTQTVYQKDQIEKEMNCKATLLRNLHPIPTNISSKISSEIKVVWLANLKRLKQPEIFIELASHFQDFEKIEFIMIGRPGIGEWQENLEIKIEQLNNLEYVGEMSQGQVNEYLEEAHILVNTSQYEGFSNTFIQAWLRKVPVVSLNVDPDYLLSQKGLGYCSGNFETLCRDVMKLILYEPLRIAMGEKARQYACENHSIEKISKQFIDLIYLLVSDERDIHLGFQDELRLP